MQTFISIITSPFPGLRLFSSSLFPLSLAPSPSLFLLSPSLFLLLLLSLFLFSLSPLSLSPSFSLSPSPYPPSLHPLSIPPPLSLSPSLPPSLSLSVDTHAPSFFALATAEHLAARPVTTITKSLLFGNFYYTIPPRDRQRHRQTDRLSLRQHVAELTGSKAGPALKKTWSSCSTWRAEVSRLLASSLSCLARDPARPGLSLAALADTSL